MKTPRRPFWSRVSVGQLVMVLAALAAFVLNVNILRSQDEVVHVAVADDDFSVGHVLAEEDLVFVELDADSPLIDTLIVENDAPAAAGQVVGVEMSAGDLVMPGFLRDVAADQDLRAFTIAVSPDHAGGGRLITARDLVDVIAVEDGTARYVVTGASVLEVAETGDRGLVAGSDYYLVLAVDADTALALAEALQADSIEVVRSTGAPAPENLVLPQPGPEIEGIEPGVEPIDDEKLPADTEVTDG